MGSYETLQCPQLTECVKCCGPLTQYCIKCNIYVGQPLTPPPSLPADSASIRASWDSQPDRASLVASQDDSLDRASWDNLSNRASHGTSQDNLVAGKTVPVNTADAQTDQSQLHQVISVQVEEVVSLQLFTTFFLVLFCFVYIHPPSPPTPTEVLFRQ